MRFTAITVAALLLGACGSSKPVRLIVAVTSTPAEAKVQMHCRKEARRETKTPARFEVFVHHTPCKLELMRDGYQSITVSVTEEMLARFALTEEEAKKAEEESKDGGGFRALMAFLQHGVEVMVAAGTEAVMGDVRTDVRLHYILEPSASGTIGDEERRSNRTTSITATAESPATNPHHSPTIPIPIEKPSSSATGKPSSQ